MATTATLSGFTAGSSVTATSSDGTTITLTGSGTTRTLSATFNNSGSFNLTVTESLANAPNSPKVTTIPFTVGPLLQTITMSPVAFTLGA